MSLLTSLSFFLALPFAVVFWTALKSHLSVKGSWLLLLGLNAFWLIALGGLSVNVAAALLVISGVILVTAYALRRLAITHHRLRRIFFLAALFLLLAVFAIAKFHDLAELPGLRQFADLFAELFSLSHPIALVGISYFVFKSIHFLVDVYQGAILDFSAISYLNYVFFFPFYFSGPIDRYPRFVAAMSEARHKRIATEEWIAIASRFVLGLFKKQVLATLLTGWSAGNLTSEAVATASWFRLAGGAFAYTLYIYFDFSGYCDMAIATAQAFGFSAPENFRQPYTSLSIQEFWTRWHISLSEWIRDYLFYPLMRLFYGLFPRSKGAAIPAVSVALSFALAGLWHGDHWHDLYYGVGHGAALGAHLLYSDHMKKKHKTLYKNLRAQRAYQIASWALTIGFVSFNNVLLSDNGTAVFRRLLGGH